jgi:hypothetical protein
MREGQLVTQQHLKFNYESHSLLPDTNPSYFHPHPPSSKPIPLTLFSHLMLDLPKRFPNILHTDAFLCYSSCLLRNSSILHLALRVCIEHDPKLSIYFNIRVLRSKFIPEDFVFKHKSSVVEVSHLN